MKIKYDDLANVLRTIHEGLAEVKEIDGKYSDHINALGMLSKTEIVPPFVVSYKTFKSNQEFEEFQKENVIVIHNVIPIYNNFNGSQETGSGISMVVAEPYIMVTYYHVDVPGSSK